MQMVWAPGTPRTAFPPEAGLPFGESQETSWFVLNVSQPCSTCVTQTTRLMTCCVNSPCTICSRVCTKHSLHYWSAATACLRMQLLMDVTTALMASSFHYYNPDGFEGGSNSPSFSSPTQPLTTLLFMDSPT